MAFSLTKDEEDYLGEFMYNSFQGRIISLNLLRSFKDRCVISDETTLLKLSGPEYVNFQSSIYKTMSLKVPTTIDGSSYGLGVFSDFDVLHSFGTQGARNTFIAANPTTCNSLSVPQLQQLQKNSAILRRWVFAQRRALIAHWDLPDGDVEQPKKKKKVRSVPTPASVANEASAQLSNVANQQSISQYNRLLAGDLFI
jgi:hypothetical protein